MKLFVVLICTTVFAGCHSVRGGGSILDSGQKITKVESVDLSATDWLIGTITDPNDIAKIKEAVLSATKLDHDEFPIECKCQLRVTTDHDCVSIRYDRDRGLLKRLTLSSVSVYRLSEEGGNSLRQIWNEAAKKQ